LTKLAALKNEFDIVELIKNFEYSISQLNQALHLKEKREFTNSITQTETQKPVLLSFLKQLLADFENFDGGESERQDIEDELKSFTETELLNTDVTRIAGTDDENMTFKELMFSLFEYAKQKAISINYHSKETIGFKQIIEDSLIDQTPKEEKKVSVGTSRNIVVNMKNVSSQFDDKSTSSLATGRMKPIISDENEELVAGVPSVSSEVAIIETPHLKKKSTLNFYNLIKKYHEISESGLLRNVENRVKYILPMMVDVDRARHHKSDKKITREHNLKNAKFIDQGVSNRSINKIISGYSKSKSFGCQVSFKGQDVAIMTVEQDQSEELAKMIKIEAQKTIQMLEMFMKVGKDEIRDDDYVDFQEIENKANEDLRVPDNHIYALTQAEEESSEDTEFDEHELFGGMDNSYPSVTYKSTKEVDRNKKVPFSKYVENQIKMKQSKDTTSLYINKSIKLDDFSRNEMTLGPTAERIEEPKQRAVRKSKLTINRKQFNDFNPGKFFKVKLKPLQQNRETQKRKIIKELNNSKPEDATEPLIGKKSIPQKGPEYFYEYQLSLPSVDLKDQQRRSLTTVKNKEIFENVRNPLKNNLKHTDGSRNVLIVSNL